MRVEKSESFVPGTADTGEPTRDAIIEECAKVCEAAQREYIGDRAYDERAAGAHRCALDIRALKVKPSSEPPSVVAAARKLLEACEHVGISNRTCRSNCSKFHTSIDALRAALQTPTKESQPLISPPPSAETMALARKAVEAQRNDKRTPEQIARDGAAFIMGGRNDTQESQPRKLTPEQRGELRQLLMPALPYDADLSALFERIESLLEGQSIAAPAWSAEIPTEPGWYWHRSPGLCGVVQLYGGGERVGTLRAASITAGLCRYADDFPHGSLWSRITAPPTPPSEP